MIANMYLHVGKFVLCSYKLLVTFHWLLQSDMSTLFMLKVN